MFFLFHFLLYCYVNRLSVRTALHTLPIDVRIIFVFDVFASVLYPVVQTFIDLFAFIKTFIDHWRTASLTSIYGGTFGDIKYFILKCFIRDGSRCQIFISICKIILKMNFTDLTFAINLSPATRNMFIISFWKETIWNSFNTALYAMAYSPSLMPKELSIASECIILLDILFHTYRTNMLTLTDLDKTSFSNSSWIFLFAL